MNKADFNFKENIKEILNNGSTDENQKVRPVYSDGIPAYTKYITQISEQYDLSKNEFPITSLRKIAWKSGIKEILAIYQGQSNTKENFESYGVKWWTPWYNEEGNLGKAYPYNLESHRGEVKRTIIKVKKRTLEDKFVNKKPYHLGNYKDIKNYSEIELLSLKDIWNAMINICKENDNIYIHEGWSDFSNFLRDIRYLPQYHLAKENSFKDWVLSKSYYKSNFYSKDTCVFLKKLEDKMYEEEKDTEEEYVYRNELSRNQVNELIKNLKDNPYSRRHIISLWNWANIDKKTLVECAYETVFTVRDGYLDMTLIQRSSDFLVAKHINMIQYVAFQMMIAKTVGLRVGKFFHFVQNLHIYDRHIEQAEKILNTNISDIEKPILILDTPYTDFYSFTIEDFKMNNYNPINHALKFDLGI